MAWTLHYTSASHVEIRGLLASRVDFKTQDDSGESSAEAQALVNAAQTIFQQGGEQ